MQIQSQIVYSYYQPKQTLPPSLEALADPISGFIVPRDPESGASYEYKKTGSLSFELCATFTKESRTAQKYEMTRPVAYLPEGKEISNNWEHNPGRVCFDRTIDPQLYPAYPKGL
ncbi:hypothetical protein A3D70_01345 [Candidatus Adlerbacteria bacterium RIFCSPHIGHO2_02_FULL_54_18]|nr:MAG: hypothetical protein A3D70_01345 [Candidatus Adlerbacteria bacterium RIFCSPHIGHO2_02_FULL_54_18]